MKIYCGIIINNLTGEIDHCATSDALIKKEMIPSQGSLPPKIKTVPPTPDTTWRTCFYEFDSDDFVRGRDFLNNCCVSGDSIAEKIKPDATIILSKQDNAHRFQNLKETSELTMKVDYDHRELVKHQKILNKQKLDTDNQRKQIVKDVLTELRQED